MVQDEAYGQDYIEDYAEEDEEVEPDESVR